MFVSYVGTSIVAENRQLCFSSSIDMDFPTETDEEFWSSSALGRQPVGKPSNICGFNDMLQVSNIIARAVGIMVSICRPLMALTCRSEFQHTQNETCNSRHKNGVHARQKFLAAMKQALSSLGSDVPEHLRLDNANRDDAPIFEQSCALAATISFAEVSLSFRSLFPMVHQLTLAPLNETDDPECSHSFRPRVFTLGTRPLGTSSMFASRQGMRQSMPFAKSGGPNESPDVYPARHRWRNLAGLNEVWSDSSNRRRGK